MESHACRKYQKRRSLRFRSLSHASIHWDPSYLLEKGTTEANYHSVRKACQFYELKSSGKYSSKTLAGRYIFQLSREVQRQISFLEEADKKKDRRITFLENLVKEWEEVFEALR